MIVQKFGGTSMGSPDTIRQVAAIIRATRGEKAIVVSAMTGVTNDVLSLIDERATDAARTVMIDRLRIRHIDAGNELIDDDTILADFIAYIDERAAHLLRLTRGLKKVTPAIRDAVMAVGEQLSARLLAAHLTATGLPAEQIDLEYIAPKTHTLANEAFYIATEKAFGKAIARVMKKGKLVVATGYFGTVPGGMIESVGRGYSDFSAALAAAGTKASELQIWTDVSGVYSADPRKIKTAEILDRMTFESAAELAHFGAKVIHPQCIHPAVRQNIPVLIKNTFEPKAAGTKILPSVPKHRRPVAAVTSKKGVTLVNVVSLRKLIQKDFLAKVFDTFARYDGPVDVVSTSEVSVSLAFDHATNLKAIEKELKPFAKVVITAPCAIVCVVGGGMISHPGIAGELFTVIGKAKINIRQISQGASERNITFVVDERDADAAVAAIHHHFIG